MLWAYFHFYQLTIDSGGEKDNTAAVIVYEAKTNRVRQCNAAASSAGVAVGMGMAQAAALCQSVSVIDYCEQREAHRLMALANRLYQAASDIVTFTPDGLALRLDPLIRYYEGLENIWQVLVNELNAAKVKYAFGVGWSIEAAKTLAMNKANQLFHRNEQIRQALSACPLSATELTDKQRNALKRVGIHSLQQLLDVPASELGRRFDNTLISYLCALRAETFPRVNYYSPPDTFFSLIEPSYEISHTEQLLPFMRNLTDEFLTFARLRNRFSQQLCFSLCFREIPSMTLTVGSAAPLFKVKQWESLVSLKLEQIVLPAPVVKLTLQVDELEDVDEQTSDFFNNRVHEFAQKQLISRLQARLGESVIQYPYAGDDFRPDQLSSFQQNNVKVERHHPLPCVSLLSPAPLDESPHIEYGPVRIQTGWWDGNTVKRDYYIGRTDDGRRLHLYRDSAGAWFISGMYC
ncbi:DNA polymerase Y family protein [Salinimonas sp. HHU 13199]|uniref:DNA polymerase Y family protein n=1 Tax=Salinimonas profundi TaxID=2729140 RepID=A0ABR8LPH1_9ALTE|nr:DNA polymerase Y family protein [Salinimonas profundi]MBD3587647.1 DNA polymerase Y family protein [Salinimonas profundi]